MTENLRPTVRTTTTRGGFARAVATAWNPAKAGGPCTARVIAVLWAQYVVETGNHHCYNFNLGNVKDAEGDGFDFHYLTGVWEGVSQGEADRLIASGQATLDANEAHKAAVHPRIAVLFQPPHPATRFRSYDSLAHAMVSHLAILGSRFRPAWPAVLAGDVNRFAQLLHDNRYFTATPEAYARGMHPTFDAAMKDPEVHAALLEPVEPNENTVEGIIHGTHVVDDTLDNRREHVGEDIA